MPTCPVCAAEVDASARFCPSCGRSLVDAGASADESKTRTLTAVADTVADPSSGLSSGSLDGGRFVPGDVVAERYRIVGLLGRGGMGEVYRADDLRLGEKVALKFLPEHLARDGAALARFHREVKVARQITHRNVCRVFDLGDADGHAFLSMEYIDGESLDTLLQRIGRLPESKAHEVARQLCAGLAAAHEKGVLHRDLKPSNVMIDGRGEAKIMDFGLAGLAEELPEGELAGTLAYMAPEQLATGKVSFRSDIYSLGLILSETYTGQRPYEARSRSELLRLHREEPPRPISVVADLDPLVDETLMRCLRNEPGQRPGSALEVSASLPGGDPLAEALRAGETPSPDMVAAAGTGGTLSPRLAWSLAGGAIALMLAWVYLGSRTQLIALSGLDDPPEVLRHRAEELIEEWLPAENPRPFDAFGWKTQTIFVDHVRSTDDDPLRWQRLAERRFSPFAFFYRQSRHALNPPHGRMLPLADDPPLRWPGGVRIELDPRGRLLAWWAVPDENVDVDVDDRVRWEEYFEAAGLDISEFESSPPRWRVPMPSDDRLAWVRPADSEIAVPLHIEAGVLGSTPTYFVVLPPWDLAGGDRMGGNLAGSEQRIAVYWAIPNLVLVFVVGLWLAHRNLASGRADTRGALRIVAVTSAFMTAAWVLGGEHSLSFEEVDYLQSMIARVLLFGALFGLPYLALEPYLRRILPHTMISWSRLLRGEFRDPRVARDVLVGVLVGTVITLSRGVNDLLLPALGQTVEIYDDIWEHHLMGSRFLVPGFLDSHLTVPLMSGLMLPLIFLLLRLLLRKPWLARLAFVAFFLLMYPLPIIPKFLMAALTLALLERLGIVAMATSFIQFILLHQAPMTTDLGVWYAENMVAALAISATVVIVCARWSTSAQLRKPSATATSAN